MIFLAWFLRKLSRTTLPQPSFGLPADLSDDARSLCLHIRATMVQRKHLARQQHACVKELVRIVGAKEAIRYVTLVTPR